MEEDMYDEAYDAWKDEQSWLDDMVDDSNSPVDESPLPKRVIDRSDPNYEEPF